MKRNTRRIRLSLMLALGAAMLPGTVDPARGECDPEELAVLTAGDADENDNFGDSVSIDGDVIVVGAPQNDDSGISSGSAYVFEKPEGGWVTTNGTKLICANGAEYDWFGESVAVSGDTLVIGAHGRDLSTGTAYVFINSNGSGNWEERAELTASDGAESDRFGYSVAIDGDTIVIGAYWDNSGAGAAYVFEKPIGGWVTTNGYDAKLTGSGDYFGYSVAVSGDTIVAGAYRYNTYIGAAHVFVKDPESGDWDWKARLTASDGDQDDDFGRAVAISSDTILIGAFGDDDQGVNTGAAYVFEKPAGGWVTTNGFDAKLTASDGANGDHFGDSVSISDGVIVIGATYDNDPTDSGAGYTFINSNGTWVEQPRFEPPDGQSYDYFGYSVATSGDTAVVGAIGPENGAGAAYVFWGLADCNTNGVMDYCDIAEGTSNDCNANGIPDECDTIEAGDFDDDDDVDLNDYRAFEDCLAGPGVLPTPASPECVGACLAAFDFDPADSDVDLEDFAAFQEAFTGS